MSERMETDEALGIRTPTPRADPEDARAMAARGGPPPDHGSMGEDPPGDPPSGTGAAMVDDSSGPRYAGAGPGHSGHAPSSSAHHFRLPSQFRDWEIDTTRFELKKLVGKGSYGSVVEALDHRPRSGPSPQKVAIKRIPGVFDIFENAKRIYREIRILRELDHPNVVKLTHLQLPSDPSTFSDLYVVFELLDTDMGKLIKDTDQELTVQHVRWFLYQLLLGMKYIHSAGVIHRDLKPANILLTEACDLKICDFGLARPVSSSVTEDMASSFAGVDQDNTIASEAGSAGAAPMDGAGASGPVVAAEARSKGPIKRQMTKHVVTRWYRAPELPLYNDGLYTAAIDVWSVGCIHAEIMTMLPSGRPGQITNRKAFFPGGSCYPLSRGNPDRRASSKAKQDQLQVIFDVMGTPVDREIAKVRTVEAQEWLRRLRPRHPIDLTARYPRAGHDALDLLQRLLRFVPEDRIRVDAALAHPFFETIRRPKDEINAPRRIVFPEVNRENIRELVVQEIAVYNPRSLPADWTLRGSARGSGRGGARSGGSGRGGAGAGPPAGTGSGQAAMSGDTPTGAGADAGMPAGYGSMGGPGTGSGGGF